MLEGLRGLSLKGSFARQALKDDGAKAPQVRLGVVLQGHDHLGRHVHGGPAEGRRHDTVLQESGETEIGDFQSDIGWLRIFGFSIVA